MQGLSLIHTALVTQCSVKVEPNSSQYVALRVDIMPIILCELDCIALHTSCAVLPVQCESGFLHACIYIYMYIVNALVLLFPLSLHVHVHVHVYPRLVSCSVWFYVYIHTCQRSISEL